MDTKQKIIHSLNSKSEVVWELIKEAIDKTFNGKIKEEDLEIAKETYDENYKNIIDKEIYRYMIIEDYNIQEDFFGKCYEEDWVKEKDKGRFGDIFKNYFSDGEGWEDILLIDMKELKAYQINKKVKYISKEIK